MKKNNIDYCDSENCSDCEHAFSCEFSEIEKEHAEMLKEFNDELKTSVKKKETVVKGLYKCQNLLENYLQELKSVEPQNFPQKDSQKEEQNILQDCVEEVIYDIYKKIQQTAEYHNERIADKIKDLEYYGFIVQEKNFHLMKDFRIVSP